MPVAVQFELPEDVSDALAARGPIATTALEAIAAEGYRSGALSETQLARMLGLPSRFAAHSWLADRRIPFRYDETDLNQDLAALSSLGLR